MIPVVDDAPAHHRAGSSNAGGHRTDRGASRRAHRADVQGLRAVAVLLVLLYHAGLPFLPGGFVGVDVFFVISGFLITGLVLREAAATGRISLPGFYARRARRILPAAALVLVTTAVLAMLVLPRTRWDDTGWHITASALSAVNWIFAADSVDYLAADSAESPVQHFWTLAVEEQFYLVWPLLLCLALGIGGKRFGERRFGERRIGMRGGREPSGSPRRWALAFILSLTIASFAWSVHYTVVAPGPAYFVTTTRLWELGVGALLAVAAGSVARMPVRLARVLGWAGLVAVLAAAGLYDSGTPFPGVAAALPTLGAAAILASGTRIGNSGVGRLLASRPLTWIGDRSYSLYLWHWPFLIFAGVLFGEPGVLLGLLVVLASLVPADLSYRFVERPLGSRPLDTRSQRTAALSAGAALVVVGMLAGLVMVAAPDPHARAAATDATEASAPSDAPDGESTAFPSTDAVPGRGAAALALDPTAGEPTDTVEAYTPTAIDASGDNPSVYSDGCHVSQLETRAIGCTYGDPLGGFSVALVGDSHAAQWVPALRRIAEDRGWKLTTYTKSRCAVGTAVLIAKDTVYTSYRECIAWNSALDDILTGPDKPDLVVTSNMLQPTLVDGQPSTELAPFASGLAEAWQRLEDVGVPVVALVDTPFVGVNVPDCVAVNETTLTACAVDRSVALDRQGDAERMAAARVGSVPLLDLNHLICPASRCAPIIGDVLVYRDDNHMTATYAETLHPALYAELDATGLLP
ncbi:acyltransferase family protein [Planctomonas psychrotolerans]|uniref:acyltransferase family protein n=1 Tax=Planctomonas psychrotolerans TaxID=2528712 RepID=UPI00123B5CB1|nr:acyltransferase family protein [Planctomonas psychrotolerans]